jgi:hypothetical protein
LAFGCINKIHARPAGMDWPGSFTNPPGTEGFSQTASRRRRSSPPGADNTPEFTIQAERDLPAAPDNHANNRRTQHLLVL